MDTVISKRNTRVRNRKRSRAGCTNCKRLRIKCSEEKPKCEYCSHTGKDCEYPDIIRLMLDTNEKRLNSLRVRRQQLQDQDQDHEQANSHMLDRLMTRADFLKMKNEEEFHQLTNDLSLIQSTTQLGISKFELRLLKFFNTNCVNIFSYGNVNPDIHHIWINHVPKLFLQSELLRKSIYSFACVCLFPLCDLEDLCIQDDLENEIKFGDKYGPITFNQKSRMSKSRTLDKDIANSLYIRTTDYFMDTIATKNDILAKEHQSQQLEPFYGPYIMDSVTANALSITSVLIFCFLGVHPHRLLPLVSFKEGETDFLSICKGLCTTIVSSAPVVRNTVYFGLFDYDGHQHTPPLKKTKYRLILNLKSDLEFEYSAAELDSTIARDFKLLLESILLLNSCFYRSITKQYPVPLYKWIILLPAGFHELVHERNFFALRMLYIYSCQMSMTRFHVFDESNLWSDYMNWFKNYNFKCYNGWKFETDENLYTLIFEKHYEFSKKSYASLGDFDPDFLVSIL